MSKTVLIGKTDFSEMIVRIVQKKWQRMVHKPKNYSDYGRANFDYYALYEAYNYAFSVMFILSLTDEVAYSEIITRSEHISSIHSCNLGLSPFDVGNTFGVC